MKGSLAGLDTGSALHSTEEGFTSLPTYPPGSAQDAMPDSSSSSRRSRDSFFRMSPVVRYSADRRIFTNVRCVSFHAAESERSLA